MAQPRTLDSFNPFITHPFTNNNALKSSQPSDQSRSNPSSTAQYTANAPGQMQTSRQSSTTPSTIHSPQPTRPITLGKQHSVQRQPKAIFTPFQQDRYSPELEEILLRKKLTQALGSVALGQHNGYPPS